MGIWLLCDIVYLLNIFKFRFDVYWLMNINNECMINNILFLNKKNENKLKNWCYKGGVIWKFIDFFYIEYINKIWFKKY